MLPRGPGGILGAPGVDGTCAANCREGSLATSQHHLRGGHILATMALNLEILGLHWWLVTIYVSC